METKVAQMTKDELREMIETTIEQSDIYQSGKECKK